MSSTEGGMAMTNEERVARLHQKMRVRRQMKERRKTRLYGAASCALLMCLVALVVLQGGVHQGTTASLYAGATMLFEDVGGYVLLAIVAFMAGVCVTVVCMRMKHHDNDSGDRPDTDIVEDAKTHEIG
ncbi:MAG: hypothetical protein VZQ83_00050 [Eubacterium sp.]|nr:hypothetical protein [Eubacterium sp.]